MTTINTLTHFVVDPIVTDETTEVNSVAIFEMVLYAIYLLFGMIGIYGITPIYIYHHSKTALSKLNIKDQ